MLRWYPPFGIFCSLKMFFMNRTLVDLSAITVKKWRKLFFGGCFTIWGRFGGRGISIALKEVAFV